MFGAVAENPKSSESRPSCTVSSTPARDDSDDAFLKYATVMFRSHVSSRGDVPRLRNTWFEGDVDENNRPTSMNPPYCHGTAFSAAGGVPCAAGGGDAGGFCGTASGRMSADCGMSNDSAVSIDITPPVATIRPLFNPH